MGEGFRASGGVECRPDMDETKARGRDSSVPTSVWDRLMPRWRDGPSGTTGSELPLHRQDPDGNS
jgi:hypothetical protein